MSEPCDCAQCVLGRTYSLLDRLSALEGRVDEVRALRDRDAASTFARLAELEQRANVAAADASLIAYMSDRLSKIEQRLRVADMKRDQFEARLSQLEQHENSTPRDIRINDAFERLGSLADRLYALEYAADERPSKKQQRIEELEAAMRRICDRSREPYDSPGGATGAYNRVIDMASMARKALEVKP